MVTTSACSELTERGGPPTGSVAAVFGTGLRGSVLPGNPVRFSYEDLLDLPEMNGEPLPPDSGYPVRVIVPHWAGIASIKWVGQIEVSATPLVSYWNTEGHRCNRRHPAGYGPRQHLWIPFRRHSRASRHHGLAADYAAALAGAAGARRPVGTVPTGPDRRASRRSTR
jgi:hypothetical protein